MDNRTILAMLFRLRNSQRIVLVLTLLLQVTHSQLDNKEDLDDSGSGSDTDTVDPDTQCRKNNEPINSYEPCDDRNPNTERDTCIEGECRQCRLFDMENKCVKECNPPLVKDIRTGASQCVELLDECSKNCIECDMESKTCTRCLAPSILELNSTCVDKCADGSDPIILFLPKLSWECKGLRDTGDGQTRASASTQPATATSEATTQGNSGQESDGDDGLGLEVLIVIAVFGSSVLLLLLVCCCIYCKDRSLFRHRSVDMPQVDYASSPSRSRQATTRQAILMSTVPGPAHADGAQIEEGRAGGNKTTTALTNEGYVQESSTDASAADQEFSNIQGTLRRPAQPAAQSNPLPPLTGAMASEFFVGLDNLRKHRRALAVLLQEMERRRDLKQNNDRQKYDKIIRDLTRILMLMKQKKTNRVAPGDGMQLLAWASRMVTQFSKN